MKAIVIGATGATGRDLVNQLLADDDFEYIEVFSRRSTGIIAAKLHEHIVDFENIPSWQHEIQGDILFSALGTTLKQAGSQKKQWHIDYDYQVDVAKAARQNGVSTLVLVSSIGANTGSQFFYSKMKGAIETAVRHLGFPRIIIMRPPSLIRKGSDRFGEKAGLRTVQFLNKLGLLRSLTPLPTEEVAACMIATAKDRVMGERILEAKEMRELLHQRLVPQLYPNDTPNSVSDTVW